MRTFICLRIIRQTFKSQSTAKTPQCSSEKLEARSGNGRVVGDPYVERNDEEGLQRVQGTGRGPPGLPSMLGGLREREADHCIATGAQLDLLGRGRGKNGT